MSATAPTTEELKAEKDEFVKGASNRLFNTSAAPVKQPPRPKPVEEPAPEPEPTPEPAPVAPPAEPPKPPAAPPVTPAAVEPPKPSLAEPPKAEAAPLDSREIESAVERALEKHTPAPAPVAPAVKFSPKDQYTITVLRKMEAMNPSYVGIADKTIQFWKDEESFIEAFVKANPDRAKEVDKSDEYEAWLEKNEPQYDEFDFKQAENALIKEEVAREAQAKINESDRKQAERQKLINDQPVIQQLAYQAVIQCVVSTLQDKDGKLPAPLEAILMKDGKVVINNESSQKLAEEDPVAYQVLLEESEKLNLCVQAMETLARHPDAPRKRVQLQYSKGAIVPTDLVAEEADRFESLMLKRPKAETTVEGRTLVSQGDFFKETEKISAARMSSEKKREAYEAFTAKYYCLGVDEFRAGLTTVFAERARERIDSMNEVVNRKVKKATPPAAITPPAPITPTTPAVPPANDKPHSPATVSRSDVPDPTKPVVTPKAEDLQNIHNTFFNR